MNGRATHSSCCLLVTPHHWRRTNRPSQLASPWERTAASPINNPLLLPPPRHSNGAALHRGDSRRSGGGGEVEVSEGWRGLCALAVWLLKPSKLGKKNTTDTSEKHSISRVFSSNNAADY